LIYDERCLQIGWQDSSYVLFLSTVHTGADEERTQRKRKKPATKGSRKKETDIQRYFGKNSSILIAIPTVAASYNDEMNHVDRGDQLRSYTSYEHRFRRGPWQALLWSFLLDVALANPFDCRKPPLPYLAAGLANKNALNPRYIYPHLTLVVPKVPAIAKST
jgi:short subunit dehydrogenase-like uncharacterized protein